MNMVCRSSTTYILLGLMTGAIPKIGTVIADIAKSRAEIEAARLLVLSAALQVRQ